MQQFTIYYKQPNPHINSEIYKEIHKYMDTYERVHRSKRIMSSKYKQIKRIHVINGWELKIKLCNLGI